MAAMAGALKTEFLGQSVLASTPRDVVAKSGEPRIVALFQRGKKAAEKAAAPVKKAAAQVKKAAPAQVKKAAPAPVKKAATVAKRVVAKVNKPDNEELAKWYGKYRQCDVIAVNFGMGVMLRSDAACSGVM